jgi:hypothetical protein
LVEVVGREWSSIEAAVVGREESSIEAAVVGREESSIEAAVHNNAVSANVSSLLGKAHLIRDTGLILGSYFFGIITRPQVRRIIATCHDIWPREFGKDLSEMSEMYTVLEPLLTQFISSDDW